ncbi:hypothetical protein GCU60_19310 [Blastococcus saxobsidens]|uniref:SPW repeat-containing protein n=1 Tax=Blastococcus saxobsidens TaxID=138336 RepID=A0A6L9W738_9ACTN|nr:hypothetical protein [Blastococcus saxobsidens]NEK87893.1 hypothetical protein [Blastococcus saxobsidens]
MMSRGAQVLIVVSILSVAALAAWYWSEVWEDSGSFAFALFGIPAACAVIALAAERATRTMAAPVLIAVLAAVAVGWSLITGLGIGLVFLVPSVLLLLAAAVSWGDRGRDAARPVHT